MLCSTEITLMNMMAQVINMFIALSKETIRELWKDPIKNETKKGVFAKLLHSLSQHNDDLCSSVEELLQDLSKIADSDQRYLFAMGICCCLDEMIDYDPWPNDTDRSDRNDRRIHLGKVVPFQSTHEIISLTALNTNFRETQLCLAPKLPVSYAKSSFGDDGDLRDLSSREAMFGINKELKHVIYYPIGKYSVTHIILPERSVYRESSTLPLHTRVAFTPITDCSNNLKFKKYELGNKKLISLENIQSPEDLEQRFQKAWLQACEYEPDVLFAPEMLATEEMVELIGNKSAFLKPLIKVAKRQGLCTPRITIMPTRWKNQSNRLLLFNENGILLGTQYKHTAYVSKTGRKEDLSGTCSNDLFLVHLENQQRIAISICSEFLYDNAEVQSVFCSQLGTTLLLVPSYSNGEQDFVDTLQSTKQFGTSVIWGNSCGAVESGNHRIIGAGSFAGIDNPVRFGSNVQCDFNCKGKECCLFITDIPTRIFWEKPDSPSAPKITHIYL